ncbi:MAG: alpha amylase C-terminal domain-containing protein [Desulfovibrio sp.]|jgi:1,4-alpha-glucan branching enzyme|nr:alpha amylase C-terminal domain-containing protein [Desulfovibrio sp.]
MSQIPGNPLEDKALTSYRGFLLRRARRFAEELERIVAGYGSLRGYADLHIRLGVHKIRRADGSRVWRLREYMPNAEALWLTTDRLNFQRHAAYRFQKLENGVFQLSLPEDALEHGTYMELRVKPQGGGGGQGALRRVPAFAAWVEQDAALPDQWCARLWAPEKAYRFRHRHPAKAVFPRIYEAHVGMAQPAFDCHAKSVGSYKAFAADMLPRIKAAGYTAVQLMGILEHPLYRSYGYQVSSYFAPSSRFGTPGEFRELVDTAHGLSLMVILDIPHGHACANTEQGLAAYDGSRYFFNSRYNQWGTPSFDYALEMTRRFLLSNCRWWLEEFRVDGFRFDAVGNMIYADYGLDDDFSHVGRCFYGKDGLPRADEHGELHLCLANALIHQIRPQALSIAEEFSGMPGLTCSPEEGGLGFDRRFAMGIPDYWEKCIESSRDMGSLWHEMTNHRPYDRTISYVECHDQCINGHDAMIWRLIGRDMYDYMSVFTDNWNTSRGLAFYRLMRLITLCAADAGYLNFMGNEFGHPEWLDDERRAHRQWHLAERPDLKYAGLAAWDRAQMALVEEHAADFRQSPLFRFIHEDDRLLAFERGRLLLAFNFHELRARTGLLFAVTPGKYVERLSSDESAFAGRGNLCVGNPPVEHFTSVLEHRYEQDVTLYLPPMTALVLRRED